VLFVSSCEAVRVALRAPRVFVRARPSRPLRVPRVFVRARPSWPFVFFVLFVRTLIGRQGA
jgi:hypothetical protein